MKKCKTPRVSPEITDTIQQVIELVLQEVQPEGLPEGDQLKLMISSAVESAVMQKVREIGESATGDIVLSGNSPIYGLYATHGAEDIATRIARILTKEVNTYLAYNDLLSAFVLNLNEEIQNIKSGASIEYKINMYAPIPELLSFLDTNRLSTLKEFTYNGKAKFFAQEEFIKIEEIFNDDARATASYKALGEYSVEAIDEVWHEIVMSQYDPKYQRDILNPVNYEHCTIALFIIETLLSANIITTGAIGNIEEYSNMLKYFRYTYLVGAHKVRSLIEESDSKMIVLASVDHLNRIALVGLSYEKAMLNQFNMTGLCLHSKDISLPVTVRDVPTLIEHLESTHQTELMVQANKAVGEFTRVALYKYGSELNNVREATIDTFGKIVNDITSVDFMKDVPSSMLTIPGTVVQQYSNKLLEKTNYAIYMEAYSKALNIGLEPNVALAYALIQMNTSFLTKELQGV